LINKSSWGWYATFTGDPMKPGNFVKILLVAFLLASICNSTMGRFLPTPALAETDITVYDDALAGGWDSWSWDTTINFSATAHVHSGTNSLAATFTAGYAGLSLHAPGPIDASGYTGVDFWANGGSGDTQADFYTQDANNNASSSKTLTLPAATWTHFTIPLNDLGSPAVISRLTWWNRTGGGQPTFYLDDSRLLGDNAPPTPPSLSVDAALDRAAISPYIYGINLVNMDGSGDAAFYAELELPVRRWGGNASSRYNYQNDISMVWSQMTNSV
jgi:hypothetical protein